MMGLRSNIQITILFLHSSCLLWQNLKPKEFMDKEKGPHAHLFAAFWPQILILGFPRYLRKWQSNAAYVATSFRPSVD